MIRGGRHGDRHTRTAQRPHSPTRASRTGTFQLGVTLALVLGIIGAIRLAWLCDDAFISFRYADNLVHGLGLVFNAGERVEGYSNFLWTLGIAMGMRLGVSPESWTIVWGVVFYLATIALLCSLPRLVAGAQAPVATHLPLAGLLAAVHRDWNVYATSGLETSCFTFLVTLAYGLAIMPSVPAWTTGLTLALVSLTRPDGLVFAPLFLVYMVVGRPQRLRSGLEFAGAFLLVWLPYVAWKINFYGDFFPNTYYAKSAAIAWWDQGWVYVRLYFQKYWPLALAIPIAVMAWMASRPGVRTRAAGPAPRVAQTAGPRAGPLPGPIVFAALIALTFTAYVMRVGGDFMYARFLIPVTPLYLLVLESGMARLLAGRSRIQLAVSAALVIAIALTPYPVSGAGWQGGIVNERDYYKPEDVQVRVAEAETLRRYFAGLPVRIAIVGSQAMLAYYARPEVAIEAVTGLTDSWVAHQALAHRGRVGHEKIAPVSYLLSRRVDFVIEHASTVALGLKERIPLVPIYFDRVPGYMVHWNPPLLAEMAKRGARFVDFAAALDERRADYDRLPTDSLRIEYAKLKTFYFNAVPDSMREEWFKRGESVR